MRREGQGHQEKKIVSAKPAFTFSESTIETRGQYKKSVQSEQ